jgi:hypothetical protein
MAQRKHRRFQQTKGGSHMNWKIKVKGEKYIAEFLLDDLDTAIAKADQWRNQGAEVWIEDINGDKVDEATLSKAADQIH